MTELVPGGRFDAVVHSAAVSDYLSAGVFSPAPGTRFDPESLTWTAAPSKSPTLVDRQAGKVKSSEEEMWLRLVRAPKLVDRVRREWGFRGVLVKFKLEVGVGEDELVAIAEASRRQSDADLMAANTLEGASYWAYVGPLDGTYRRLPRAQLSPTLLAAVEALHAARGSSKE